MNKVPLLICLLLLAACGSGEPEAGAVYEIEKSFDRGPLSLTVKVSRKQITVADLTGVAVQDIQIAKAVYNAIQ